MLSLNVQVLARSIIKLSTSAQIPLVPISSVVARVCRANSTVSDPQQNSTSKSDSCDTPSIVQDVSAHQRAKGFYQQGFEHSGAALPSVHTHPSGLHYSTSAASAEGTSATGTSIVHKYISQELVTDVSSTINRLTGYEGIDRLKARVVTVDEALSDCKKQLQVAKAEYEQQLAQQGQLHREVTALLQRKSSWVPADVARFTELYAAEHETEGAVAAAKARYSALSDDVELLQLKLVDLIRERYQQEQAWSDKIRRASTWWTWGLMGLHFASFMAVYTVMEPRRRHALTAAVSGMLQQHTASIDARLAHLTAPGPPASQQPAASSPREGREPTTQQQQQQQQSGREQGQNPELPTPVQPHTQAASAQVDSRVLQELERIHQQLQQIQGAHAATHAGGTSPQAPAAADGSRAGSSGLRQWAQQQVSVVRAAAAAGGQALVSRSKQLPAAFNPLRVLTSQQQEGPQAAAPGRSHPGEAPGSVGSSSLQQGGEGTAQQAAGGNGSTAADVTQQPKGGARHAADTPQQQQLPRQQASSGAVGSAASPPTSPAAPAAAAGSQQSPRAVSARGPAAIWGRFWQQQGGVVELTRGQLVGLCAALSTGGAAVGAAVVLMLRGGGGAAASFGGRPA